MAAEIPLFTSLAPRCRRTGRDGTEIGERYQSDCITSWKAAGFQVYSINSRHEALPEALCRSVTTIRVERDAFSETGRRLLYLKDIFDVITDVAKSGPFVFTNGDILLVDNPDLKRMVAGLRQGECIVEKRLDVTDPTLLDQGTVYYPGFDFFAFTVEDISTLNAGDFVFGVPWWDHFIPLNARFSGLRRIKLPFPACYHLDHSERWDLELWLKYADLFERSIVRQRKSDMSYRNYIGDYHHSVDDSGRMRPEISKRFLRRTLEGLHILRRRARDPGPEAKYHRMSGLNIQSIDLWGQEPAAHTR